MDCANQIGVRNIFITFFDCDNNVRYPTTLHELSGEEQPTYKFCPYSNEAMTGGFSKRARSSESMQMTIIRDLGIPLALYQGCSSVDITVEHFNGMVVSGVGGTIIGDEKSDAHEVTFEAIFEEIDELLPRQVAPQAA